MHDNNIIKIAVKRLEVDRESLKCGTEFKNILLNGSKRSRTKPDEVFIILVQ